MVIPHFQLNAYSQANSEINFSDEYDCSPKYEVGFSFYSNLRDYQLGDFYESKIDFAGEFGFFLNQSMTVGLKLIQSYRTDKAKSDSDGVTTFRLSCNPFFRYYFSNNMYCESGVGLGYGFHSFRDNAGDLLADWEGIRINSLLISAGYDLYITKNQSLLLRPSINYMFMKERIPDYPNSANNNRRTEFSFSIGFIIHLFTPINKLL